MTQVPWRPSATELAEAIRARRVSARGSIHSVLGLIDEINPRVYSLVGVHHESALAAADAAVRTCSLPRSGHSGLGNLDG